MRGLCSQGPLVEEMILLGGAPSGQQGSVRPPASAGAGSGRQGSSLFPLKGRGFARVARWRNPRGRIRDAYESCPHAGSIKQESKEMVQGNDTIHARSQVPADLKGARPEPTGFESSVTNLLPLPFPFWEIVSKGAAPARLRRKELREALLLL
jgi:hypothetical protein